MLLSMAFARSNDYDDDKDPTWSVNIFDPEGQDKGLIEVDTKNYDKKFTNWFRWKLALLATRTFTERSTFYWPGTATELLTSPSTAKAMFIKNFVILIVQYIILFFIPVSCLIATYKKT